MNAITASTMPRLKLALYTTVDDEWADVPDSACLAIGADQARAILALMVLTTGFRDQAHRAGLLNRHFSISAGTGENIPDFRLIRLPLADGQEVSAERPVVRLPDDFSADAVADDDECRVECHRIEVGDGQVRFTALAKHSSHRFTTADLTVELLHALAEGRAISLPSVRLLPDEAGTARAKHRPGATNSPR